MYIFWRPNSFYEMSNSVQFLSFHFKTASGIFAYNSKLWDVCSIWLGCSTIQLAHHSHIRIHFKYTVSRLDTRYVCTPFICHLRIKKKQVPLLDSNCPLHWRFITFNSYALSFYRCYYFIAQFLSVRYWRVKGSRVCGRSLWPQKGKNRFYNSIRFVRFFSLIK